MIKLKKNTFYNEQETRKRLSEFIIHAGQLSMGENCRQFEEEFSRYQGRKYSVLFNSGSSANLALVQSLINLSILKRGNNVGFSALTWPTNVMPLIQLGLNPVPIDVSLKNLNINSENLMRCKKNLEALLVTNLLGFSGDLDKIRDICYERGIVLIEDNCESLGSELKGRKLGNFGLASTMSFFVGHHLSTIEGGMVSTDDENLYDALKMVRAHGWSRNLDKEKRERLKQKNNLSDFYEPYSFYFSGFNLRPTEITGFLGLDQLRYVKEFCLIRERNFKKFQETVSQNPDILQLDLSHMGLVSNFAYPLIFKNKETFEKYLEKFSGKVEIRPIVGGSMVEQPFYSPLKVPGEEYPNARQIHQLGFYIPNREDLTEEEINAMVELLKEDSRAKSE